MKPRPLLILVTVCGLSLSVAQVSHAQRKEQPYSFRVENARAEATVRGTFDVLRP